MTDTPIFSAEVSLIDDSDDGLRIECSEKHVMPLKNALSTAGFECAPAFVAIPSTSNIANWVEFTVTGGTFAKMNEAVLSCLETAGVSVSEETVAMPGEKHVRLHLENVSLFQ